MQKLPPFLAELGSFLVASSLAILAIYKGLPALIKLWQERNKPKAEQELIHAQAIKAMAEAGEVRTRSDVSLIQIALGMAEARRVESDELREKVERFKNEKERLERENERMRSELGRRGNGRG